MIPTVQAIAPLNYWHTVEVLTPDGMECAMMEDTCGGVSIAVRLPGQSWPYGIEPKSNCPPGRKLILSRNDMERAISWFFHSGKS